MSHNVDFATLYLLKPAKSSKLKIFLKIRRSLKFSQISNLPKSAFQSSLFSLFHAKIFTTPQSTHTQRQTCSKKIPSSSPVLPKNRTKTELNHPFSTPLISTIEIITKLHQKHSPISNSSFLIFHKTSLFL